MAWTQVSDRRWERPIDGIEEYFVFIGSVSASHFEGREHFTLFSTIEVAPTIPSDKIEDMLKKAWTQLRYEQPQLAATVNTKTRRKVYEVPDETELQAWLAATFIVSKAPNADELYATVRPISKATLYYLPRSSELVFRVHHHIMDGTGILMFWDQYLGAIAAPREDKITFGDEPSRLAPSFGQALGVHDGPTPGEIDKITQILTAFSERAPGIGLASTVGRAPAGQSRQKRLLLSPEDTKAIIQVCKERGVTVTSAVHAAFIQAITKTPDPNLPSSHYVTCIQFNLRRYLPHPFNTPNYAAALYYTPLPFVQDLPSPFWSTADALNKAYTTTFRADPSSVRLIPHLDRAMADAVQAPDFQDVPISHDPLPSSLGIIEQYLKREYGSTVSVKDVSVGVDIVLGPSMFFISTFRDRLRMDYSFNDGYEDPVGIERFLESVRGVLLEEMLG
ncbi:hypothetical protein BDV12DRAFT_208417 [Aspergillus spectabilis]